MKRHLLTLFLLAGCGSDVQQVPSPTPTPNPIPNPGPGGGDDPKPTSWQRVEQIHQQYCIQCHANSRFIRDAESLKASSAKARVQNGSMPPPNGPRMPPEVREEYLDFFFPA